LVGVADALDIIDESADESADDGAAAPMSDAAGVAMALLSLAALESTELSVLLAGCEHPARARPAMAARMATVDPTLARRAEVLEMGMLSLRLTRAKHPARRPVPPKLIPATTVCAAGADRFAILPNNSPA
jgi:hypothetical protein